MTPFADNLAAIRQRIQQACQQAGRPAGGICLLAVSKTVSTDAIREAFHSGQRAFGENYLQEALTKIDDLSDFPIEWHFIGPLQSNKTRPVATHFAWAHGVDSLKVARRLSEQRPAGLPPLNVCIQVNISAEASKSGIAPEEAPALADAITQLPNVRLRGLMAIPSPTANPQEAFRSLHLLLATLQKTHPELDTLSMGMSADLDEAIAEGATIVRVGTALFGPRPPKS